ncbi:MAG: hypothetical protein IJK77_01755 [Lachnospiraceae bacterium]|nr:hypothetical protein [Lachnospiraceae bacterium]
MAVIQEYSLAVNGEVCGVSIEVFSTALALQTAGTMAQPAASGTPAARNAEVPRPAAYRITYAQPTQATWVTARRVAHLPFH